jgi:hypothetical protein
MKDVWTGIGGVLEAGSNLQGPDDGLGGHTLLHQQQCEGFKLLGGMCAHALVRGLAIPVD